MIDIRLGFGPRERRRILLRLALLLVLCALLFPGSIEQGLRCGPAVAWIVTGAGLVSLAIKGFQYASEATLLTAQGVVLNRRTVAWERITRIEARRRAGLFTGTPRMTAYLQLADGAPVRVPGLLQAGRGLTSADFQQQLGVLLERWQQETSHNEPVLVSL